MTEQEWLTARDPEPMLLWLGQPDTAGGRLGNYRITERKLTLYACACCRRVWDMFYINSQHLIETAEVDGKLPSTALNWELLADRAFRMVTHRDEVVGPVIDFARVNNHGKVEKQARANLLREIIGNPYLSHQVQAAAQTWNRNVDALAMAQVIYHDNLFADLPVLADALEEAGCSDYDILSHLRAEQQHVKGCWALDTLLGLY